MSLQPWSRPVLRNAWHAAHTRCFPIPRKALATSKCADPVVPCAIIPSPSLTWQNALGSADRERLTRTSWTPSAARAVVVGLQPLAYVTCSWHARTAVHCPTRTKLLSHALAVPAHEQFSRRTALTSHLTNFVVSTLWTLLFVITVNFIGYLFRQ